jgi:homoaconitase/3-isopropylmalate dehydratase large subunit
VNLYPKIVLYHDVLSEEEISYIRNEGRDKVKYDQNVAHLKDHLMSITKDQC